MEARPHIRAAGGVLHRRAPDGTVEIAVVHRPRYDDWTLPKGKLEPDETVEDAAVREVEEETGIRASLGPVLGDTTYTDGHGRPKIVTYFAMTPVAGTFTPNNEVDELRWLSVADAIRMLTHERDRSLVVALET